MKFNCFLYISICFLSITTYAQETEKKNLDTSYWTNWNFDYQLNNLDSLFFEVNTRSSAFDSYIVDGLNINRAHIMTGYAHHLTEKLYLGASIRSVFEPDWNVWYWRLFLQHNGQIGDGLLDFQKRIQYEYITPFKQVDTPGTRDNYGRFGFWLLLGKDFNIGKPKFRTEFSYEFFINNGDDATDQRLVDLSRLRLDMYWYVSDRIRIGAFAMRNTEFYFAPATGPSYDANGELISEGKPERNLNRITPVYGFSFKYSIPHKEECNCPGEKRRKRK
ncbi:hypothetical protein [Flammeovirga agarivorans]|uniref:DUF2490 domain-containing protein n=1 Tax=Flammeovirga agarivorans TaxID=2726742 RepID=A0A7X8SL00_9BACT|nr:hypothetical protein [Flammeovirga agarivorans]NLR92048.1 hypothetical protein [Flammeovirga agarivorans]